MNQHVEVRWPNHVRRDGRTSAAAYAVVAMAHAGVAGNLIHVVVDSPRAVHTFAREMILANFEAKRPFTGTTVSDTTMVQMTLSGCTVVVSSTHNPTTAAAAIVAQVLVLDRTRRTTNVNDHVIFDADLETGTVVIQFSQRQESAAL